MKAGIDLDGVVADLIGPSIKKINKRHYHNKGLLKKPLKREDITSYYFADCIPGLDWDEIVKIWDNSEFILNQPLLPWARWGVKRLKDLGYEVYIVTARQSHLKAFTLEWLKKRKIPFDDIVTGKREEKLSYIERNKLDIFVDDRARNALDAAQFCKRVYLIDKPYNRQLTARDTMEHVFRVLEWRDIIRSERGFLSAI